MQSIESLERELARCRGAYGRTWHPGKRGPGRCRRDSRHGKGKPHRALTLRQRLANRLRRRRRNRAAFEAIRRQFSSRPRDLAT